MKETDAKTKRNSVAFRMKLKRFWIAFSFIAPAGLFFIVFRYYTSFQSLVYSFFNYKFSDPPGNFIGFDNYIAVFSNPSFYNQLWNTVVLFLFGLAFGFWVPIVQALLLNELTKGRGVIRYLYVVPAGIPSIAMLAVQKYIWDPTGGLANAILQLIGIESQGFLIDPDQVKICLRILGLLGGGVSMLIYYVAINNISDEFYEAAKVDGATRWRMMFSLTLPNMKNIIGIQLLLSLSSSLLAFDDIFVLTQGGPGGASETIVMGIYNSIYYNSGYGIGMAMSVIVLVITVGLVSLQLWFNKRGGEA